MTERFPCPYLNGEVELTDERRAHLFQQHPDLWPRYAAELAQALADPDTVGTRGDDNERGFVRWFAEVHKGEYIVAVVRSHVRDDGTIRHWLTTAYIARRTNSWLPLWQKR